jgi:hypothetical protein
MKYKQVLTPFREFRVTAAKTTFEVKTFHILPISQLRSSFIQRLQKKEKKIVCSGIVPGHPPMS